MQSEANERGHPNAIRSYSEHAQNAIGGHPNASRAHQRPSVASGTVKVSRKRSMAFGYLPPLVSSLLFGGMYHSAAITCGSVSETMREAIRDVPLRCDHLRECIRDDEGGNQGCTTPLRSPAGVYPRQ